MAAATCGVCLPNRLPRLRKLPFAVWSTRSPAEANDSTSTTLSSAATSARSSGTAARAPRTGSAPAAAAGGSSPSPPHGPTGRARPGDGPAPSRRRGRRRSAPRRTSGQRARCTDSGAERSVGTKRSCQTRSVTNGVSGAISRVSTSQRLVQRRERRRVAVPEPAPRAADVPVRQVVDERREQGAGPLRVEVLQRLGDVAGQPVQLREQPPVEHRSAVAQQGRLRPASSRWSARTAPGTPRCSSRSAAPCGRSPAASPCPTRRAAHGDPDAAMNQRTASAPCSSISGIGSRMLPRCLDILRPSSASSRPRQTTFSYDDRSNTSVPTAISE